MRYVIVSKDINGVRHKRACVFVATPFYLPTRAELLIRLVLIANDFAVGILAQSLERLEESSIRRTLRFVLFTRVAASAIYLYAATKTAG